MEVGHMMKYRQMGSLDWQVSALGFGAMRLPTSRRFLVKTVDTKEAIETIRMGIDRGINYVDTAWMYHLGRSESIVGDALQDGYRERVKLVTKLPIPFVRKADQFDTYLETQLKRLKTDYLDIYLLHGLNESGLKKTQRFELVDKLERAKKEGKIRHLGFSFHDTLPVFKEIVDYHPWDLVMVQHNYMDTGVQATSEGVRYAHEKGMAVVVMEPVKGGMLANPPKEALDIMASAPVKRSPVDWALQFLWNKPEVSVVLSGMSARDQVEENCDSAERSGVGSLSPEELSVIDRLADVFRRRIVVGCTACGYCMPCKQGVDIPDCFSVLNNVALVEQGDFNQRMMTWFIRRRYKKKPQNEKQREKNPDVGGGAALCTACGACIKKCPQELDIPAELEKVHAVLAKGEKVERHLPKISEQPAQASPMSPAS
jgi:predicted aldo/keto reductase-like oxidoreductase